MAQPARSIRGHSCAHPAAAIPAQAPPNRRSGPLAPPDTLRIPFGHPADWFTGAWPSPPNCPHASHWMLGVRCWMLDVLEREIRAPSGDESEHFRSATTRPRVPPLPWGECQGEGERALLQPHQPPSPTPSTCSTGEHQPLGNLPLPLTPNFSWVCGGRRGDGTASAVSPSRMLARIHAGTGHRGHRKPLKRLGRSGGARCTQLKLGANLMVRKRELSGLIPPNAKLTGA